MFSATTCNKAAQKQYQWVQCHTGCILQMVICVPNTRCLSGVRIRGIPLYRFLFANMHMYIHVHVCLVHVCSQQIHFLYMIYQKLSRTYMYSTQKRFQKRWFRFVKPCRLLPFVSCRFHQYCIWDKATARRSKIVSKKTGLGRASMRKKSWQGWQAISRMRCPA